MVVVDGEIHLNRGKKLPTVSHVTAKVIRKESTCLLHISLS